MSHNQQLFGALVKRSYRKYVGKLSNIVKKNLQDESTSNWKRLCTEKFYNLLIM